MALTDLAKVDEVNQALRLTVELVGIRYHTSYHSFWFSSFSPFSFDAVLAHFELSKSVREFERTLIATNVSRMGEDLKHNSLGKKFCRANSGHRRPRPTNHDLSYRAHLNIVPSLYEMVSSDSQGKKPKEMTSFAEIPWTSHIPYSEP